MARLRSLELSLAVPFAALHNHHYGTAPQSNIIPRQSLWAETCVALSDLCHSAALQSMVMRLDLAEDDRFWWEVRETWALGAISDRLRQCTRLHLPEITVDVDRMKPFQYASLADQQELQHSGFEYGPLLAYSLPPHGTTKPGQGEEIKRQTSDFEDMVRYRRRRWTREGDGDGVQARLEFFIPRDHAALGPETLGNKMMKGLFRGMLMS